MIRALTAVPVALAAFFAVMILAALAMRTGLVSDDAVSLWAGAIAAGDGEVPIGRIIAAYPSLPFMTTALLEYLTPVGTPTPALIAGTILALICILCFVALRDAGIGPLVAMVATALTALHPAMLRAAVAGPAEMFFALFMFMFASGLYQLRARSAAPEVMSVGLALLGLAFSHPLGAAVCIAAVPLLILAVRPALAANSSANMVIALIFPTVFCVGAFAYVSWVFPGSGWSFLAAPDQSLAAWSAGMSRLIGAATAPVLAVVAGLATVTALALGAPLAAAAIILVRHRMPLAMPPVIVAAAVTAAAMFAVGTGLFGDPALLVAAAPILAATMLMRVGDLRARSRAVVALLVLGWFGGLAGLLIMDPRTGVQAHDLWTSARGDAERIDALALGRATIGVGDVLVDTYNAPAVVLGRAQAAGLIGPNSEAFSLALMFVRIDTPFVAVADPQSPAGAHDSINRAFPLLYRRGIDGYHLVYQNRTWRLYARADRALPVNQQ